MFQKLVTGKLASAGITINGDKLADIEVVHSRFYRRAAIFGSLGVGDSYSDGDFLCQNLEGFFEKWMNYKQTRRDRKLAKGGKVGSIDSIPAAWVWLQSHFVNQQTILRSKRVGKRHYDIGNTLYRRMLGPTMAYSCGYWKGATTLDHAQRNKYRLICEKLGLKKGDRVLEIGCGWGGFAAFAVREYGVTVVGVSISQEQINSVKETYPEACASGSIDLRFMDYREIPNVFKGEFDAIVSIGMFEHVGPKNYRDYMRVAWFALKPGGKFLLHSIVGTVGGVDAFIWYRIFLGGILPLGEQIPAASRGYFTEENCDNFGHYYYRTLMAWWENFKTAWPEISKDARYDDKFYRMWEFYLKSCAAAFKVSRIQLNQYVFAKVAQGRTKGVYDWNRPVYPD